MVFKDEKYRWIDVNRQIQEIIDDISHHVSKYSQHNIRLHLHKALTFTTVALLFGNIILVSGKRGGLGRVALKYLTYHFQLFPCIKLDLHLYFFPAPELQKKHRIFGLYLCRLRVAFFGENYLKKPDIIES